MAWNTPTSVSPGDAILASLYNEDVVDNLTELAPFFGAFTSYTPTLGTWTIGNGTISGSFLRVGKFVAVNIIFTLGSTTTTTGSIPTFSLPSGLSARSGTSFSCPALLADTGTANYKGLMRVDPATGGSTVMFPQVTNTSGTYPTLGNVSNTVPHTWASTDVIRTMGPLIYETAS